MIRHGTKTFKLILALLITLLCFLIIWLGTWKSPDVNHSEDTNIHTCFHTDDRKLNYKLGSGEGNNFDVYLVENSKPNCLNPYFPSIHIQASQSHNAWIHIVYTDSQAPEWRTFIDTTTKNSSGSTYPFYTYEQDFYDAPLWTYSLFNKPIRFWKGHAFAVKADHQNKSINCIGGIEWGFALSDFRLRPKTTAPRLLNKEHWEKAWQILQDKLPGYSQTYGSES